MDIWGCFQCFSLTNYFTTNILIAVSLGHICMRASPGHITTSKIIKYRWKLFFFWLLANALSLLPSLTILREHEFSFLFNPWNGLNMYIQGLWERNRGRGAGTVWVFRQETVTFSQSFGKSKEDRSRQGKPPPPPVLLNIHKCGVRLCWLETRLSGCSIVHVTDSPGKSLLSCETCKFKKIEFHSEKMWFYYFFLKLLDWIQLSPLPVLLLLLLLFSVCGGVCCIFW